MTVVLEISVVTRIIINRFSTVRSKGPRDENARQEETFPRVILCCVSVFLVSLELKVVYAPLNKTHRLDFGPEIDPM